MATAFFESRQFTNTRTGEIINYDVYGIKADVNGEYMELNVSKLLDAANKIAWKIIASGDAPVKLEQSARAASADEVDEFFKNTERKSADNTIDLESDD